MCDNTIETDANVASAAIKAQRAKFRFPKQDPQPNEIVDVRSDAQKYQTSYVYGLKF